MKLEVRIVDAGFASFTCDCRCRIRRPPTLKGERETHNDRKEICRFLIDEKK